MKPERDPLLLEIAVALGAGNVTIGPIHSDAELVHGYCVEHGQRKGAIVINPAVETVDTAIHELTHRLRPSWTERTVRQRTAAIIKTMSNREIDKFYELIQVRATRRLRPVVVETD